jgi:menaquinone-specific isochorismate synthase
MPPPAAPADVSPTALAPVREAVERRLAAARAGATWRVERVTVPVEPVEPLAWLAAQPFSEKMYWHGRGETGAWAGVGIADLCSAPAALQRRLDALAESGSEARYLGGFRFAPGQTPASEWEAFGAARFVLPRVELAVDGRGGAALTVNLVLPRDTAETVRPFLRRLHQAHVGPSPLPLPVGRTDAPDLEDWREAIEAALAAFDSGEIEKVVLARRATYTFEDGLDPFALLRSLEAATPSSFHFALQPAPGVAFVGATPERLFRREGSRLWTEAVAGTRPRASDPAADARLRADLLASEKDRREHGYVRDQILEALAPFCAACDADATSVLALASKWHLRAAVRAGLRPGARTLDLLAALHPTPAVGGTPTEPALARIAASEPFDRGWYAGPVGWVGAEEADFAVAIRSGLVRQSGRGAALDLYSGAGIVAGSDPEAEWAEIEDKIVDFARVLGLEG